jgi:hypothetical protein
MRSFDDVLSVPAEELEIELRGPCPVPWADFILNPRRLRGSDFLMRWSQGVWSEHLLIQAVEATGRYVALPYGPSGTAPDHDVKAFELYFERLEKAGLGQLKRPDLLIFRRADQPRVQAIVQELGGVGELPFTQEDGTPLEELVARAILAVECENSLWRARQMPDYGSELRPMNRLGGQLGLKKGAVLPTVIVKEEDRLPLRDWQRRRGLTIHVWHAFYDLAFGIALDSVEDLIRSGKIEAKEQVYQAPGGATTTKITYNVYYHYAYPLAESVEEPKLIADHITDKNGHILPYVKFQGGRFVISDDALRVLQQQSESRQ